MAKNTSNWSWRGFINLISFIAIVCIGIALLIGKISSSIGGAFGTIAEILAYFVTAISAFYFAVSRRHWAYYVVWAVCVILIIVLMVI